MTNYFNILKNKNDRIKLINKYLLKNDTTSTTPNTNYSINTFAIVASYTNTKYYLPGTLVDLDNLKKMSSKTFSKLNILYQHEITFDKIAQEIKNSNPNIIWLCGHGILKNNQNYYVLPIIENQNVDDVDPDKYFIKDETFGKMLVENQCSKICLIVVDICHSATFLNLKYYYKNLNFYEKVNDTEYQPQFNNDQTIICISGATDFDPTFETSQDGGYITSQVLNLINEKKSLCLSDFDNLIPTGDFFQTQQVIVSTNKIMNPFINFLKFY